MSATRFPELFRIMAEVGLHLHHAAAFQWWTALEKSRCGKCAALRALFQYYSVGEASYQQLLHVVWKQIVPHRIVHSLECLVTDGHMGRQAATRIEEALFAIITRDGTWRPYQAAQTAA